MSIRSSSSIQMASPTARSTDSARLRCAALALGFAYSAVAPLCTSDGVFGMVRTMAVSLPSQPRRAVSRIPAAIEITSTRCAAITSASSTVTDLITRGLTASTTASACSTALRLSCVVATEKRCASRSVCCGSGSATRIRSGFQPSAMRPPTRLRAMLPPPIKASRESVITLTIQDARISGQAVYPHPCGVMEVAVHLRSGACPDRVDCTCRA